MRITGRNIGGWLLVSIPVLILLGCAYLVGYWTVLDESWAEAISVSRLMSLPLPVLGGFGVVSVALAFMAARLTAYAHGQPVKLGRLIFGALALFAALYGATYDDLGLVDLYPLVALLVISFLLFRVETKVVAAILFGVIMVSFFSLNAKELGERDAERAQLSLNVYTTTLVASKADNR